MAEISKNGKYVHLNVNIWMDKRDDSIHITSNDKDLPGTKLHMTAKKGTQSDKNLRELLETMLWEPEEVCQSCGQTLVTTEG